MQQVGRIARPVMAADCGHKFACLFVYATIRMRRKLRPDAPLDSARILLYAIIGVGALSIVLDLRL